MAIFAIWMLFFDQNNMVDRIQMKAEIRQLENDREYYLEQIQIDSARLHELTTNRENLEKYAREQFLMKKKQRGCVCSDRRARREGQEEEKVAPARDPSPQIQHPVNQQKFFKV